MAKFTIGTRVYTQVTPGIGTIIAIKKYGRKGDYYQVEFSDYPAIWHPENEITLAAPEKPVNRFEGFYSEP